MGVIAVEFAMIFSTMGFEVTMLARRNAREPLIGQCSKLLTTPTCVCFSASVEHATVQQATDNVCLYLFLCTPLVLTVPVTLYAPSLLHL